MSHPTKASLIKSPSIGTSIRIRLPDHLYKKDPEQTDLGRVIISGSILLLHKIGFEAFTFKKLATDIKTTEASVYRYFTDKQMLMQYLETWYWSWLDLRLREILNRTRTKEEKINAMLLVLAEAGIYDPNFEHIDESKLHRVIIAESRKGHKANLKSDKTNKHAPPFAIFHSRLTSVLKELAPKYKFPKALALSLISIVHSSMFYGQAFPEDIDEINDNDPQSFLKFLKPLLDPILA